jgi:hypothetical protein
LFKHESENYSNFVLVYPYLFFNMDAAIARLLDGGDATFAPFIVEDVKEDASLRE